MRIAHVGLRCVVDCQGGVERHVRRLAEECARRGHEVSVFCRDRYNPNRLREHNGVRIIDRPAIYTKHLEALSHTAVSALSCLRGYDVVHFHALGPNLMSFIPRLAGTKAVATVHGLDFLRPRWGRAAGAVLRAGAVAAAVFPHAAIVVSPALQEWYARHLGRKTVYIPNGVDEPVLRPLDGLKRFGVEAGRYALFLGRLVPDKGVDLLVRAFSGLDTDWKLVVAGGIEYEDGFTRSLRALAGEDPRVVLAGPLYGADKDEAFSNAGLFVLPSLLEGMPLALLEAASYGCPAVMSDIPECAGVFDPKRRLDGPALNGGLCRVFNSGGPESLARTMAESLADPGRADMGRRARDFVLENYRWGTVAEQTLAVYHSVHGDA